jgi:hypothetical protein
LVVLSLACSDAEEPENETSDGGTATAGTSGNSSASSGGDTSLDDASSGDGADTGNNVDGDAGSVGTTDSDAGSVDKTDSDADTGSDVGSDTALDTGNGPPHECTVATEAFDCKDFVNCTEDLCVDGACSNPVITGCCKLDAECDDGVVCTIDKCNSVKGECIHTPGDNTCCVVEEDCFDGDECTDEHCIANTCVGPQKPECECLLNSLCDDGNPCTLDECVKKVCKYTLAKSGQCCVKNADCDDGDLSNYDGCQQGLCWHAPLTCSEEADCLAGDPCLTISCKEGQCQYEGQSDCCVGDADCSDGLAATEDLCMNGQCVFLVGKAKVCAQDSDCVAPNPCVAVICASPAKVCTYAKNNDDGCCYSDEDCGEAQPCTSLSCEDFQCKSQVSPEKTLLWESNFDDGTMQGWVAEGDGKPAKWQPSSGNSKSPQYSLYYGQLPQQNTAVGVTKGYVTSPLIEPPNGGTAHLSFWRNAKINPGLSLDKLELHALIGGQLIKLWDKSYKGGPGIGWKLVELNISESINGPFQLRFSFDSLFSTSAIKEGVYIDDVQILQGCL